MDYLKQSFSMLYHLLKSMSFQSNESTNKRMSSEDRPFSGSYNDWLLYTTKVVFHKIFIIILLSPFTLLPFVLPVANPIMCINESSQRTMLRDCICGRSNYARTASKPINPSTTQSDKCNGSNRPGEKQWYVLPWYV